MARWELLWARQRDWDKDDLLDVIYWLRVIGATACGLVCGLAGFVGLLGFAIFVLGAVLAPQILVRRQGADVSVAEPQELIGEGMGPGFATFLGLWILLYSTLHV